MQWATAVGLEKCNGEQKKDIRQRIENRQRTEKPITEATLIVDGSPD